MRRVFLCAHTYIKKLLKTFCFSLPRCTLGIDSSAGPMTMDWRLPSSTLAPQGETSMLTLKLAATVVTFYRGQKSHNVYYTYCWYGAQIGHLWELFTGVTKNWEIHFKINLQSKDLADVVVFIWAIFNPFLVYDIVCYFQISIRQSTS